MSKASKTYKFKTKEGIMLVLHAGSQEAATLKLASLVKAVADWPYVRVFKDK
jgi:hypothetical protein